MNSADRPTGHAIDSDWITLDSDGERQFGCFRAQPASGRGVGILLLHDMFGITPPFRDLAEHYARQGHPVLVPNQFWRAEPSGDLSYDHGHRIANARLAAFDFDGAVEGMRSSLAALRRSPHCTGTVMALGFCFSGRLAYLAAARTDVDAAVGFYALGISHHLAEASAIHCPLQLHYGLADEHVPLAEIDAVAAALAGRANVTVHRYEGAGHSFFNPVRPMYDPAAAALAAQRVDALLATVRS